MAIFNDLKEKYKQALSGGKQGLSSILERTTIDDRINQSFVRPIQNKLQQAELARINTHRTTGANIQSFLDKPIPNYLKPVNRALGTALESKNPALALPRGIGRGTLQGGTYGFVRTPNYTAPTTTENIGEIAGNIVGSAASFNKIAGPLEGLGKTALAGSRLKDAYLAKMAVPAVTREVGQSLAYLGGSKLGGEDVDFKTDLAFGLGISALGGAGKLRGMGKGFKGYRRIPDVRIQDGDVDDIIGIKQYLDQNPKLDIDDQVAIWKDVDNIWNRVKNQIQEPPQRGRLTGIQKLEYLTKWAIQNQEYRSTKKYVSMGMVDDAKSTLGDMGSLEKAVVDRYGLTNNPKEAAFITSDGNYVKTSGGDMDSHLSMVGGYGTEAYLKETGSIRMTNTNNALYIQTATPLNKYQEMAIFKATTDNPKKTIVVDYTPEPQDQGGRVMGEFGIKSGEFNSIDKVKSFIKRQHQDYLKYADSIAPKGEALTPAELKEFAELSRLPQGQLVQDYAKEQRYNLLREKYNNQAKDKFQSLPQPTKGDMGGDLTWARGVRQAGIQKAGAKAYNQATRILEKAGELPSEIKTSKITKDFIKNYYENKKPPVVGDVFRNSKGEVVEITKINPRQVWDDATSSWKQASGAEVDYQLLGKRGNVSGTVYLNQTPKTQDISSAPALSIPQSSSSNYTTPQPTKGDIDMSADTKVSTPAEIFKARELEKRAKQVRDMVYNAKASPETINKTIKQNAQALEKTAKQEFNEWQRAVVNQSGGKRTTRQAVDVIARNIQENTRGAGDISNAKDISNLSKGFNTVYRNFKTVFGEQYPVVKKQVLDPFDRSKGLHIDELNKQADALESNIVKGLGIEKGSKESAAIQLYGEGKISAGELVERFGKKRAADILAADRWFRSQYDQLLDEVNAVRKRIYPNNPDKIIPRRKDYYRHFREMREGFGALLNIFDSPGNIAPGLESISETTKPRSKWLSFAQKRLGDKSDIDAVGGFLDYIRASSYAKNIDPHIQVFRNLREDLIQATGDVESPNYGKVNNFINFLDKYANDLSGKTNQADRVFQEIIPGGRKTFSALNWLNNRVKANVILGNISSSLAQTLNLPQGVASAGKYNLPGLGRTMNEMFSDAKAIKQSDFIKERYAGDVFSRFDRGLLNNTKKFAVWMTGALDEVSTKYMWNAHYEKALAEGLDDPVKYADDITRNLVGGRGIGEVPLMQKARTFQFIAPFQLEVGNLWYVMKDMVDEKQFGKIATLFVMTHIMNRGLEAVRGSGGAFDPIQAMIDMYEVSQDDEDNKALRMVGRGVGEVLSNVPLGQTVAGAYDEYGYKIGDRQLPTREALFGDSDPTRFGSGVLASKGLQDPLFKVLPPYAGNQIKKTLTGIKAYNQGFSETKTNRVRYPVDKNPINMIKSAAFGEYSTGDAREYFDRNTTPLGEKQSDTFKKLLLSNPSKAVDYYNSIMGNRDGVKTAESATAQVYANEQNPLPKETELLGVLYKKGKQTTDGYAEDRVLIEQDPTLTYDERIDKLQDLESKQQAWSSIVKRIEQERPEQVLDLQIDTYKSGGSMTTEERAKWVYDTLTALPSGQKKVDLALRLVQEKVVTKSVMEALRDTYDLQFPAYNEGGKLKVSSRGGSSKTKKIPKDLIKPIKLVRPQSTGSSPRKIRRSNRPKIRQVSLKRRRVVNI